jgi:secondary thiamine-phosphate synthase enzyme
LLGGVKAIEPILYTFIYTHPQIKFNYLIIFDFLGFPKAPALYIKGYTRLNFYGMRSAEREISLDSRIRIFHYESTPLFRLSKVQVLLSGLCRAALAVEGRDMKSLAIFYKSVKVSLGTGPDIRDITPALEQLIDDLQVRNGNLCATMVGSTGSLTTIEYEPGVVRDLMAAVNRLAPPDLEYEHEKAWHDGNGHSHVQAALLGPSIVLPIRKGRLKLGTWQQVVAINHDNRARQRTIEVTIIG